MVIRGVIVYIFFVLVATVFLFEYVMVNPFFETKHSNHAQLLESLKSLSLNSEVDFVGVEGCVCIH